MEQVAVDKKQKNVMKYVYKNPKDLLNQLLKNT